MGGSSNGKKKKGKGKSVLKKADGVNKKTGKSCSSSDLEALQYDLADKDTHLEESDLTKLMEQNPDDPRNELLMSLNEELRGLKAQIKERASEKVEEILKHHFADFAELSTARTENVLNALNMLSVIEISAQDRVNREYTKCRQLETENSNIRADIAALKLSTSETIISVQEVEKRTRGHLNRIERIEEQKRKLQIQIEEQKQSMEQLNQEISQLNLSLEDAEAKWKEQFKEKRLDLALVEEEQRLLKSAETNLSIRKKMSRQQNVELKQWMNNDIDLLEKELANLRISQSFTSGNAHSESFILHNSPEEKLCLDRACIVCSKDEACILFLPCAHQVLCSKCNENTPVGTVCPCCRVEIDQKVQVYGTSS